MGVWTSTPHDATAGAVLTAAQWDATVRDGFNAFGAMTSYTPTWSSLGTQPALGNGTLVGAYSQIQKTVFFRIKLTTGSTSTYGTSAYALSLPVTVASGARWAFSGFLQDSSTGSVYAITGGATSTTASLYNATASPLTGVSATAPFTFATGDTIDIQGWYEAT
jgi:hypothetical protein